MQRNRVQTVSELTEQNELITKSEESISVADPDPVFLGQLVKNGSGSLGYKKTPVNLFFSLHNIVKNTVSAKLFGNL